MIIFLNGPFGVGKTTIAEMLVKFIPNSMLFDAEEVGYFLCRILKNVEQTNDFQDLAMWRPLVVTTTRLLLETYNRTLIMPMTIWYRPYFDQVIGGIHQFEPNLYHFCLTARKKTLTARLLERSMSPDSFAWCMERNEQAVKAFQSPVFAQKIETDEMTQQEVMDKILSNVFNT